MGLVKRIKYTISAIKLIPYKILYGNRLNTGKQINLGSKTKIVVTKCGKIEIANDFESKRFCYLSVQRRLHDNRTALFYESECKCDVLETN